jgi:hypothetical protein
MSKIQETYYWPLWLSRLLSEKEKKQIKLVIPKLSRAQIYLWRALNIYDDFLDGTGEAKKLPLANRYYRHYLKTLYQLGLSSGYYHLLNKTLDKLDYANQAEVSRQKLKIKGGIITLPKKLKPPGRPSDLARKSLALAFCPLALLGNLGYKISDKKFQALLKFFQYALAAKQLSDDSHDWREDLAQGLITSSNFLILKAAQKRKIKINLKSPLTEVNLLYAQVAAPLIIKNLEKLCHQARQEMVIFSSTPKNPLLQHLIKPLEVACYKAKRFRTLIV